MFIDYLTLMLINLSAGLVVLALFVFKYLEEDSKKVVPGLLITGLVATVTGFYTIFTWPLPGSVNVAFGDASVFFGVLMLAGAFSILFDWSLLTVGGYAVFAGVVAIIIGARLMSLHMTSKPILAGIGYILTGAAGILAFPLYFFKQNRVFRYIVILVLLAAAVIWAITGFGAYWDHLASFTKWKPLPMR